MKKNKKLLIITPYSYPSPCGMWKRVYDDAITLIDLGFEVYVFSSNIHKGTKSKLEPYTLYNKIHIFRFPVKFSLGENALFFSFYKKYKEINPDFVHVHGYRHPHSLLGLFLGKINKKKVSITSHGAFLKDPSRPFLIKAFDFLYDLSIGWWQLRIFNKIFHVSKWEKSELRKRGAPNKNLIYSPNGISDEFFKEKIEVSNRKNAVLYMGRIDPVKRPEWIINAAKELSDTKFTLHGPVQIYDEFRTDLENVEIINEKYDSSEFIQKAKDYGIFTIASIRESFGFVALEAMSQGLIVISSNTKGANEYIVHGENGFLAENEQEYIDLFRYVIALPANEKERIRLNAIKTAKEFKVENTQKTLVEFYS